MSAEPRIQRPVPPPLFKRGRFENPVFDMADQRPDMKDIELIRSIAASSGNADMLAWAVLMQEVLHIRDLLEQQDQACYGGNRGCNSPNNGEDK